MQLARTRLVVTVVGIAPTILIVPSATATNTQFVPDAISHRTGLLGIVAGTQTRHAVAPCARLEAAAGTFWATIRLQLRMALS